MAVPHGVGTSWHLLLRLEDGDTCQMPFKSHFLWEREGILVMSSLQAEYSQN